MCKSLPDGDTVKRIRFEKNKPDGVRFKKSQVTFVVWLYFFPAVGCPGA